MTNNAILKAVMYIKCIIRDSIILSHKMLKILRMCGIITLVINMLIYSVIQNEAERNGRMIRQYEELITTLPRGSLICRKNEYYYLKYREGGKVCDKYIGKDPKVVSDIRSKLERRKHYEDMLASLKQEQKEIQKILGGLV